MCVCMLCVHPNSDICLWTLCSAPVLVGPAEGKAAALPGGGPRSLGNWAGLQQEPGIEEVATLLIATVPKKLSKTTKKWCQFKAE